MSERHAAGCWDWDERRIAIGNGAGCGTARGTERVGGEAHVAWL